MWRSLKTRPPAYASVPSWQLQVTWTCVHVTTFCSYLYTIYTSIRKGGGGRTIREHIRSQWGGECRLGTKDATSFDEKDIVIVGCCCYPVEVCASPDHHRPTTKPVMMNDVTCSITSDTQYIFMQCFYLRLNTFYRVGLDSLTVRSADNYHLSS